MLRPHPRWAKRAPVFCFAQPRPWPRPNPGAQSQPIMGTNWFEALKANVGKVIVICGVGCGVDWIRNGTVVEEGNPGRSPVPSKKVGTGVGILPSSAPPLNQ